MIKEGKERRVFKVKIAIVAPKNYEISPADAISTF